MAIHSIQFFQALILFYNDLCDETFKFISEFVGELGRDMWTQLTIFLKYVIIKEKDKLHALLTPDFIKTITIDPQNSYHIATFYSYVEEKEKSLDYLENAVNRGFINYPLLSKHDKLLNNIGDEQRFKNLMERVKYEW